MPTFRAGKGSRFYLNQYEWSTYLKEAGVTSSAEMLDATAFTNNSKAYIVGLMDAKMSISGMFDGTASSIDAIFAAAVGASTNPLVTFAPEGSTIGRRAWSLEVLESSYDVKASVADLVMVSAEFQSNTDDAGSGVILMDSTTSLSATGGLASVDNAASTTNGGYATLHVTTTSRTGAGNTTIVIEHSVDNSVWATLATFTAFAATGLATERKIVASGTTVNRYLRANVSALGGTAGSFSAIATFVRQ